MIAGESETLYAQAIGNSSQYDNLFGIGKRKKQKRLPKEQRGKFWKSLGRFYQDAGGVEGIGSTANNLLSAFRGSDTGGGQDYSFGLQAPAAEDNNTKSIVPAGVYIIGGVVLVVVTIAAVTTLKKQPSVQPTNLIA